MKLGVRCGRCDEQMRRAVSRSDSENVSREVAMSAVREARLGVHEQRYSYCDDEAAERDSHGDKRRVERCKC